jgi:hypothetical protein
MLTVSVIKRLGETWGSSGGSRRCQEYVGSPSKWSIRHISTSYYVKNPCFLGDSQNFFFERLLFGDRNPPLAADAASRTRTRQSGGSRGEMWGKMSKTIRGYVFCGFPRICDTFFRPPF